MYVILYDSNDEHKFEEKLKKHGYEYESFNLPRVFWVYDEIKENAFPEISDVVSEDDFCYRDKPNLDKDENYQDKNFFVRILNKVRKKQKIVFKNPRIRTSDNWGLLRISNKELNFQDYPLKGIYAYNNTGKNVNVYVVDTGVDIRHPEIKGRSEILWSGYNDKNDNVGHGTHVATTIAGKNYGVAKKAHVKAVKVLEKNGGSYRTIIQGLEKVLKDHKKTNKPSVVNMSIGGPGPNNNPLQRIIKDLTENGVVVVVAAGNEGKNLDGNYNMYPAMSKNALTVGATDVNNRSANFSNYGETVDIWAPGHQIVAGYKDKRTAVLSGTSMASPHVAGVVARKMQDIGRINSGVSVKNVKDQIIKESLKDTIEWIKDHRNQNRMVFVSPKK